MTVAVATKRTIAMAIGEATLNFLITGVTFKEIMLSGLGGFIGNFVSDGNLKWTGTVGDRSLILHIYYHILISIIK